MSIMFCPKCKKELNEYEINKLWCTSCNSKFKSLVDLHQAQKIIKKDQELIQNFLITTGYQFEGYNIVKYLNLVNGEVVLGTGFLSELSAKVNDILGSTSEKLEDKLQEAKKLATRKIINSAIEIDSNAIIGFRFEILSLSNNIITVSAYGTAVNVIKEE